MFYSSVSALTANPPLGSPVEPLVYIITATSLGLGPFLIMDATR